MTKRLSGQEVAARIRAHFLEAPVPAGGLGESVQADLASSLPRIPFGGSSVVFDASAADVYITAARAADVARFLRDDPDLALEYLVELTAVDYIDYFEVVYRMVSFRHNHTAVMKTRVYDRDHAVTPSVTPVWKGAELQEREVYDLMGIRFQGHPNMKRIMLWEGFDGHPLRKDFLLQRP